MRRIIPRGNALLELVAARPHSHLPGASALLPVDVILGVPSSGTESSQLEYSRRTVDNLQLAYEIARRNLKERTKKS